QYMAAVDGILYAQEMEKGIMRYENGVWKALVEHNPLKKGTTITGITRYSADTVFVATMKDGLFYLTNGGIFPKPMSTASPLATARISGVRFLGNDLFALGTHPGGMWIMDKKGQVVQRYSYSEGLQTNNVRDIFKDRNGNLWLALDDGIDYVAINSAIKYIYPDQHTKLGTYSMRIFGDKLY